MHPFVISLEEGNGKTQSDFSTSMTLLFLFYLSFSSLDLAAFATEIILRKVFEEYSCAGREGKSMVVVGYQVMFFPFSYLCALYPLVLILVSFRIIVACSKYLSDVLFVFTMYSMLLHQ